MLNNIIKLSPEHFPLDTIFKVDGVCYVVVYTHMNVCAKNESGFIIGCLKLITSGMDTDSNLIRFYANQVEKIINVPSIRISSLKQPGPIPVGIYHHTQHFYYEYAKLCKIFGISTSTKNEYKCFDLTSIVMTAINNLKLYKREHIHFRKLYDAVDEQTFVKRHSHMDSQGAWYFVFVVNKKRLNRFLKQNINRYLLKKV